MSAGAAVLLMTGPPPGRALVLPTPVPASTPILSPSGLSSALPTGLPTVGLPGGLLGGGPPPVSPSPGPTGGPSAQPGSAPAEGGGTAASGSGAGASGTGAIGPAAGAPSGTPTGDPLAVAPPQPVLFAPPVLPAGPAGAAVAAGLVLFPVLVAIWLLLAFKTYSAARSRRSDRLRFLVAADLGVRPMELAAMPESVLHKVHSQVALDDLTGVLRRGPGLEALHRECARAARRRRPLAVAFVDVDGLKKTNDTKGHNAGDALLREVGGILRNRLRGEDLVFRFGGDEFVCVLPETTLGEATPIFQSMLASARTSGHSFSFGLAEYRHGEDEVELLGRADGDLYRGREARRKAGEPVSHRAGRRRKIDLV